MHTKMMKEILYILSIMLAESCNAAVIGDKGVSDPAVTRWEERTQKWESMHWRGSPAPGQTLATPVPREPASQALWATRRRGWASGQCCRPPLDLGTEVPEFLSYLLNQYLLSTTDAKHFVHQTRRASGPSLLDAESLVLSLPLSCWCYDAPMCSFLSVFF